LEFIKQHAVELDEGIIRQHIDLYVNDFSIDIGHKGKESVDTLANEYKNHNGETIIFKKLFV
jgi:1,4-dihydroxy-6-naphthoate synthase